MLSPTRRQIPQQQRAACAVSHREQHIGLWSVWGTAGPECGWITFPQIEAKPRAMTRYVKRGEIWIRIFPTNAVNHAPAETRKWAPVRANPEFLWCGSKPVRILFADGGPEITGSHRQASDASGPVQACGQNQFNRAKPKMATTG